MNIIQIEQSNAVFSLMIFVARLADNNNAAWVIVDNMVSTPAIFHRTKNHFVTGCGWYEVRDINTDKITDCWIGNLQEAKNVCDKRG